MPLLVVHNRCVCVCVYRVCVCVCVCVYQHACVRACVCAVLMSFASACLLSCWSWICGCSVGPWFLNRLFAQMPVSPSDHNPWPSAPLLTVKTLGQPRQPCTTSRKSFCQDPPPQVLKAQQCCNSCLPIFLLLPTTTWVFPLPRAAQQRNGMCGALLCGRVSIGVDAPALPALSQGSIMLRPALTQGSKGCTNPSPNTQKTAACKTCTCPTKTPRLRMRIEGHSRRKVRSRTQFFQN